MGRSFIVFLILYLVTFLLLKEEIHHFSHHLKETAHAHSLSCFFEAEKEEPGLKEACLFHDLYLQKSFGGVNFSSLKNLLLFSMTPAFYTATIYKNFSFFPPLSRGPPKFS